MSALYTGITNSIIAALERGAASYRMPWHCNSASHSPRNAITAREYHGINTLLLWAAQGRQGHSSPLWATYRQWRAIGAQVRQGERSTVVILYRPLTADEQKADCPDERQGKVLARAFRVFNADQVEGFTPATVPALPETERLAAAELFCNQQGATIWTGSDSAFYDPSSDVISMPTFGVFKSAAAYYSVLLHELGHWTGAKSRLDRDLSGRFGTDAYAMEELVAELTAAFVCAHLGLEGEPRRDHAPYIASWLRVLRGDNRAVLFAASRAQVAADFLIERATAAIEPLLPIRDDAAAPIAEMAA